MASSSVDDEAIINCNIISVACWVTILVTMIVIEPINLGIKSCLSCDLEIETSLSATG